MELFFDKVVALQATTLLKIELVCRFFSMIFWKYVSQSPFYYLLDTKALVHIFDYCFWIFGYGNLGVISISYIEIPTRMEHLIVQLIAG